MAYLVPVVGLYAKRRKYNDMILGSVKTDKISPNSLGNNNVMVVGSSGSGKTSTLIVPNLMTGEHSVVVSDPKGSILTQYGEELEKLYDIRVLNIKDLSKSMHYDPLKYVTCEEDVLLLAHIMVYNGCSGEKTHSSDPFWDQMSVKLLCAIIGYLKTTAPERDQIMDKVIQLLQMAHYEDVGESPLDILFEDLEREPELSSKCRFFLDSYNAVKSGATITKQSVVISAMSALAHFSLSDAREMTRFDEMNMYDFVNNTKSGKPPAIFVITDDINPEKNFIATILYTQLLSLLCKAADNSPSGALKTPAVFFLDDFATVGRIPNFDSIISNIRSRNISVMIALQNESQLFAIYGERAKTIIGNCYYYIYMGSTDPECIKNVSNRFKRTPEEIINLPHDKCLIDCGGRQKKINKGVPLPKILNKSFNLKKSVTPIYSSFFDDHYKHRDLIHHIDRIQKTHKRFERGDGFWSIEDEIDSIKRRDAFFDSKTEGSFYKKLQETLLKDIRYRQIGIIPHCQLSNLFVDQNEYFKWGKYKDRIKNMHCDFILINYATQEIIEGIEIDGPHHSDKKQIERDRLKDSIFEKEKIPLIRIPVSNIYKKTQEWDDIFKNLDEHLELLELAHEISLLEMPGATKEKEASKERAPSK